MSAKDGDDRPDPATAAEPPSPDFARPSRRDLIKRVGLSAGVLAGWL